MKIVIIGGTGLIGSRTAALLRQAGHDVLAVSPSTGVDAVTGEGLAAALDGAQVVLDLANSPSFEDAAVLDFFGSAGRNLLAAEAVAGVGHHVALSVVGTDRLPDSGYLRGKLLQETLIKAAGIKAAGIKAAGIPYTIVRSTQFFEFLGAIAGTGDEVRVSTGALQPIAADDVAAAMAAVALAAPVNGTIEIAGPERLPMHEMVGRYLTAMGDGRTVVGDAGAPYFGTVLEAGSLVPAGAARLGSMDFAGWFARARLAA